jgi:hypothetical protein
MKDSIIERLERIEAKLDAVIKALHEYDGNDEYGESSFEAFMDIQDDITSWKVDGAERIPPCVGHDKASWNEEEANKRMDIIGQNGNEGSHHVTNEEADEDAFDDYGQRVVGDRDSNNNPAKHTVGDKKKSKRKYYKPKNKG